MKYKLLIAGVILTGASFLLSACGSEQKSPASESVSSEQTMKDTMAEESKAGNETVYQKISQEEAKKRIDSGDKLVILDVRTQEEYEEKHIEGAVLIPNEEIGSERLEQLPDLNEEILIYCRSGNRSAEAAKKMIEAGYTNVYDFGGINDWSYDTVSGLQSEKTTASSETTADSGKTESSNGGTGFGTFTTTDLDGASVNQDLFSDYDLTMVNIWATFCGPCLREMPELGEINTEYADKGFQIVGIVTDVLNPDATISDEMMETAKYAVEQTQANYTHLVPSLDLLTGRLKDVSVVPTTIFVDKDGNQVGEIYEGSKAKADWEELIDDLLKQVK